MRTSLGRQAGFTLIEVLVALVILSLAVVASIQGFAQGLRLLTLAGEHQQAILLADQKVREIVDVKDGSDQGVEGPFRWERTQTAVQAPDLVPAVGIPLWRLYQIDVRVNWGTQRRVEIRTLRMVPIVSAANTGTNPGAGTPTRPGTPAGGTTTTPAPTSGRPSTPSGGFPGLPVR